MGLRAFLRGLLQAGVYRSQYQMAEVFGSHQPTVNHWLRGKRFPGRESCVKISKATGRPVDEIVEMVAEDTRAAERGC
jgi:transcriptional regulator with XRE-family HTH domain